MIFHLTQSELQKAIEFYLNERVVRTPVTVKKVTREKSEIAGTSLALSVDVITEGVPDTEAYEKAVSASPLNLDKLSGGAP